MEMEDLQHKMFVEFLEGTISSEDLVILNQWKRASDENEKYFNEVRFLWEKTKLSRPRKEIVIDVNAALSKVHQELDLTKKVVKPTNSKLSIALVLGSLSLLLLLGALWMNRSSEIVTIATLSDELKEVQLPDNSIVWLNENTTLRYPKSFKGRTRAVQMTGNAVFEVVHNKAKPFIVKSDELTIKVLGTKFNVISNYKDGNSLVHVINGKVQVSNRSKEDSQMLLTDDLSVVYNHLKTSMEITSDFSSNELFWMNETLHFDNVSLKKAFEDIQKYFEIELIVENKNLLNCRVNGHFKNKNELEILETLQVVYNYEIEKQGLGKYLIKKGSCS